MWRRRIGGIHYQVSKCYFAIQFRDDQHRLNIRKNILIQISCERNLVYSRMLKCFLYFCITPLKSKNGRAVRVERNLKIYTPTPSG